MAALDAETLTEPQADAMTEPQADGLAEGAGAGATTIRLAAAEVFQPGSVIGQVE